MDTGSVLTIGVFDGVHRGHQSVIAHTVQIARTLGLRALTMTFDPNPLEVLRPEQAPTRLCPVARRVQLMQDLGVDGVEVVAFTPELAAMTAEEFVDQTLLQHLNAKHVVIGAGFRFGNRARGSAQTLREAGLTVDEFDLVTDAEPLSSTRIRAAVARGDVAQATRMLGRPHEVEGVVVAGQQRGRELGYPTANIEHHPRAAVPADGVYAGTAMVGNQSHAAAISIGTNPTFDAEQRTVEAYLLDFDAEVYGQRMRVSFLERLRPMVSFDGSDALLEQMAADVEQTRAVVAGH